METHHSGQQDTYPLQRDPQTNPFRVHKFLLIDRTQAEEILKKLDPQLCVFSADIITTGNSTSNYLTHTNKGDFFLKLYPATNTACANELAAYRYASRLIRVPKVYWHEQGSDGVSRAVLEYIKGARTLEEHVYNNKCFSRDLGYKIGKTLALLHSREYEHRGRLNAELELCEELPSYTEQIEIYLNGIAGERLGEACRKRLLCFIGENRELFTEAAGRCVFSHGDFIPNNVLVDENGEVWFIDFERCVSNTRFIDIGKIFRPRPYYAEFLGEDTYSGFKAGYDGYSSFKLPDNWRTLSRLFGFENQLSLLNRGTMRPGRGERACAFINRVLDSFISGNTDDFSDFFRGNTDMTVKLER